MRGGKPTLFWRQNEIYVSLLVPLLAAGPPVNLHLVHVQSGGVVDGPEHLEGRPQARAVPSGGNSLASGSCGCLHVSSVKH